MMLASNAQNVILRTYLTVLIVFAPKSSILKDKVREPAKSAL